MTDVEVMKIIEDVRQLKARYFRFVDTKNWEGLATVFSRDSLLGAPDDDVRVVRTRDGIVKQIRDSTEGVTTVHHGSCHEVWVDTPTTARGIIAFEDLGFRQSDMELVMHGYGHYHEDYVLEDGAWRIQETRIPRLAIVDKHPLP
jgi:hypothetical protein